MLDSFESAQEFCVVTEFAQVIISFISQKHITKLCMILEAFKDIIQCGRCLDSWTVDDFSCRVNCLRFSRMTNAFQKNKFKQLQSNWYFDPHDYCSWLYWLFAFLVFWFTIMFNMVFCCIYRWEHCTTCIQTVSSIVTWSHKTF